MNAFMKFAEISSQECALSKLAKETHNKSMDIKELDKPIKSNYDVEVKGLTDDEKKQVKEESGWSDEIIDHIKSMEEYKIYKDAGLEEAEIDGKKCLVRTDIDMNQKDEFGRTNKERIENKLSPISSEGEKIELHHIGQKADSPLAELTEKEHRGVGNYAVLHNTDKKRQSEIDKPEFLKQRTAHWKSRIDD